MRMEKTAEEARRSGYDAFTTTLLYSKRQNRELIKRLGSDASSKFGVVFFFEDFDRGWKEGIRISKEMGLFRQQYCGCIYSEWERYKGRKKNAKG